MCLLVHHRDKVDPSHKGPIVRFWMHHLELIQRKSLFARFQTDSAPKILSSHEMVGKCSPFTILFKSPVILDCCGPRRVPVMNVGLVNISFGEMVILHVRDLWFIRVAGKVIVRTDLFWVVDIKGEISCRVEIELRLITVMGIISCMKTSHGVNKRVKIAISLVHWLKHPLQISQANEISSIRGFV